ncbi:uncharacterized protein [Triticum aestivum]|uniref:uncharacterized protein n=1 Tax=Triticum aestivum TaxID=4565 RepID=UPI001D015DAD|nr:uncharacterized protein LOC123058755 [Triticum aestivum]
MVGAAIRKTNPHQQILTEKLSIACTFILYLHSSGAAVLFSSSIYPSIQRAHEPHHSISAALLSIHAPATPHHAPVSSTAHAVAFPSLFLPAASESSTDGCDCNAHDRWLLRVRRPVAARLWLGLRARSWLGLWQRRGGDGLGGCLTGPRGSVPALRCFGSAWIRSGILRILILSIVVGTASGSALVGDRCAAGSQSPCGAPCSAGMCCAPCSATSSTSFAAAASNTAGLHTKKQRIHEKDFFFVLPNRFSQSHLREECGFNFQKREGPFCNSTTTGVRAN